MARKYFRKDFFLERFRIYLAIRLRAIVGQFLSFRTTGVRSFQENELTEDVPNICFRDKPGDNTDEVSILIGVTA